MSLRHTLPVSRSSRQSEVYPTLALPGCAENHSGGEGSPGAIVTEKRVPAEEGGRWKTKDSPNDHGPETEESEQGGG